MQSQFSPDFFFQSRLASCRLPLLSHSSPAPTTNETGPAKKTLPKARPRKPQEENIRNHTFPKAQAGFAARTSRTPGVRRLGQSTSHGAAVAAGPHSHRLCGVESYARHHPKEDAGALAWLVIGYARTLDHDYAKAIDPFNRAKAGASELGDYVAYYLGDAYLKTGQCRSALHARRFQQEISRFASDPRCQRRVCQRAAEEGRPRRPRPCSKKIALPFAATSNWPSGGPTKPRAINKEPASALRNVYFNLPNSFEADAAGAKFANSESPGPSPNAAHAPICSSKPSTTARRPTITRFLDETESVRPIVRKCSLRWQGRSKKAVGVSDARKI